VPLGFGRVAEFQLNAHIMICFVLCGTGTAEILHIMVFISCSMPRVLQHIVGLFQNACGAAILWHVLQFGVPNAEPRPKHDHSNNDQHKRCE